MRPCEVADELSQILVLEFGSLRCEAEVGHDARQMHGDAIRCEPVVLALGRPEEQLGLGVSVPLYHPSAVGDKVGKVLFEGSQTLIV